MSALRDLHTVPAFTSTSFGRINVFLDRAVHFIERQRIDRTRIIIEPRHRIATQHRLLQRVSKSPGRRKAHLVGADEIGLARRKLRRGHAIPRPFQKLALGRSDSLIKERRVQSSRSPSSSHRSRITSHARADAVGQALLVTHGRHETAREAAAQNGGADTQRQRIRVVIPQARRFSEHHRDTRFARDRNGLLMRRGRGRCRHSRVQDVVAARPTAKIPCRPPPAAPSHRCPPRQRG
jgi:hypothetical protein